LREGGEPDHSPPRVIISGMTSPAIEIRDHLVGPCAQRIGDDEVVVDVGAVVRRLVLFERYTLRTVRMLDIPALVSAFGEGGLRALLADGCLRVHCDVLTMGSVGQGLPSGTFQFAVLRAHDQREYVSSCLQEVHTIAGLSDKQAQKLKRTIADALTDATGGGEQANRQLDHDLDTAAPVLRDGIALAARTELGADLDPATVRLEMSASTNSPSALAATSMRSSASTPTLQTTSCSEACSRSGVSTPALSSWSA
jgi:hypothetical protein